MPTVGSGRELLQCSVPTGCRSKFDSIMSKLREAAPEEEKKHFADRGTFLSWILDRVEVIIGEADDKETRLAQKEYYLQEKEKAIREAELKLQEADIELRKRVNISALSLQLLNEAVEAGATKDEVMAVLRLFRAAKMSPDDVVQVLSRDNTLNLLTWSNQLKEAYVANAEALTKIKEEIAAHKIVLEQLKQAEASLQAKIETRRQELDRANLTVTQLVAVARDFGLYLDYIKQSLKTMKADMIQDLHGPALVIAGTILEAVAQAYGDKEINLIPGPKHPLPMQATIREIARSLAPAEAYKEQQEAHIRAKIKAESVAEAT